MCLRKFLYQICGGRICVIWSSVTDWARGTIHCDPIAALFLGATGHVCRCIEGHMEGLVVRSFYTRWVQRPLPLCKARKGDLPTAVNRPKPSRHRVLECLSAALPTGDYSVARVIAHAFRPNGYNSVHIRPLTPVDLTGPNIFMLFKVSVPRLKSNKTQILFTELV